MSFTQKVAYNVITQVLGKGFSTILGIFTVALMMRYLSTQGFGYYSTVMAYLTVFGVIVEFGLHLTTIQMVSSYQEHKENIICNIYTLRVISAFIFFIFAPVLVWFFPYPLDVKLGVLITTMSFFFVAINQILIALMQIGLKMQRAALSEVVGRIALLALVFLVVYFDKGFLLIMASVVVSSTVNFIINWAYTKKFIKINFKFDWIIWKEVFKRSLPIGISIIFNLIYLKADMLILSLIKTQSEVGIYGATYKFLDILTTFPAMFMGLILPVLTKNWADKNINDFKRVFQKAFDFLVVLSLPIIFGTYFTAKKVILLIAGPDFLPAVPVLQMIIFSIAGIFIGGGIYAYTIIALNKQKEMMWGYIITAIVSLIAYLIFIPKYSYFGAAGVTIFSEYFISVLIIIMVYKSIKFFPKPQIIYKTLIACCFMSLVLHLFENYNLFVMLAVGAVSYFSVLIVIGGIRKEMILNILNIQKKP